MTVTTESPVTQLLHTLRLPVHRLGYQCLVIALPRYAAGNTQSLTKDVYPYVARQLGCADWHSVERAIRTVIQDSWKHRDPAVWETFFPGLEKAPTNKQFLAVLAERLK